MPPTATTGPTRDQLAEFYARRHLEIDAGVETILYLPTNAPPREIRLLEVNTMISETTPPEPIDFGVDVSAGARQVTFAPVPLMVPSSALHSNIRRSAGVSGSSTTAVTAISSSRSAKFLGSFGRVP